ncbi:hypothetical protein Msil_1107 [Methylocella silvestris BL2]|uniref:Uncharacterized protein n=1 Tax=Methylocella silvestris (strain DSM 15510 / CIP 108128 / LMG 27833 / NCIMB 13906 / BL2) TaxID=395965 RepID=B8ENE5_METSB|nr:hypothetical protein [Methylocella silvestris]ACK50076.1 hypothetical protein Msil_1107 [Methylocella silvestris BL2]
MKKMALSGAVFLAGGLSLLGANSLLAAEIPGTVPKTLPRPSTVAPDANNAALAASGLKGFYEKYGKYQVSAAAAGSNNVSHVATVTKPSRDAVVDKAFVMAASNNFVPIANGDITIDGNSITWIEAVTNDIIGFPSYFNNVRADVTAFVKPKLDAAAPGGVGFTFSEIRNNANIDGEVLVVVFKAPSTKGSRTISLLFGGQKLSGDRFELVLANAIDPKKAGVVANMGLGISYSFQSNGIQQYSSIDVNGKRLSTAAGGEDDGKPFNGALITVGGVGDAIDNPANPLATPTNPRSDDELYSLLPYLKKTDKIIRIDTKNPSNDDNIFFAYFDLSANASVNKDTDEDGLLDAWELYGYDADGDGKIDVDLPKLGANYKKKDIFIGYAWMNAGPAEGASHQPSAAVLTAVQKAFAAAPVSNPGGSKGIAVHFVSKGAVPHKDNLDPVWTDFDTIMDPLFTSAERHVFHRLLCAHKYSGGTSSGLSRGIPESDFIETLGGWGSNPGTFKEQAGTIMHELGHNLGLRHGGVDHENYKPNHLSVMNYNYQVNWLSKSGKDLLDYERFDLGALDENKLKEKNGLGSPLVAAYGLRWFSGGISKIKANGANKNVDWNANGGIDNNDVAVDLNNSGAKSVLNANFIEWNEIVFDGGAIGDGANATPSAARARKSNIITKPQDLQELTYEEFVRKQANPVLVK